MTGFGSSTASVASADLALAAGRLGTWYWDLRDDRLQWDAALEQVFGLAPGTGPATREEYLRLVHPDDRERVVEIAEQAQASGGLTGMEHRFLLPDGSVRWVAVSSRVVAGPDGAPVAVVGVTADITERKLAEQRLQFLSRAGQVLGSSLELETTFQQVCELAIEQLADWCAIDLLDEVGVRLVALAHRDPGRVAYARRLRERFPVNLGDEQGLARVLRTGEPEVLPDIDEEFVRGALAALPDVTAEDVAEFVALGLRSSLVVPLRTPTGRVLGGLTLVAEQGRRRYEPEDVALAMEVAGRAAVAVENAQLYAQVERSALTLQRSLLPAELPDIGVAELAADYHPLRSPELVGGDFYDVFETFGGRWCLLMGDVAGKGVEAAALTAAARWTVRTLLARDSSPVESLRQLDEHLTRQDWGERYVSLVVAVLERAPSGLVVHYASGGHPPPLLRGLDGTARVLPAEGSLLGLLPAGRWVAHSTPLAPGESLLLYTDGFTDVKSGDGWFGDAGLLAAVEAAPVDATAAALAAAVTAAVRRSGAQRDDRALLVLRVPPPLDGPAGA